MTDRKKAYIALILSELLWGASIPLAKSILVDISPPQYLFIRYLFASIFVVPVVIKYFFSVRLSWKYWMQILGIELIGIVNTVLLYVGLGYISSIESSLIVQIRPVFVIIAGILFLKEKEEPHELFGLSLSVVGTFLILLMPILGADFQNKSSAFGFILVVLTNFIYMFNTMQVKKAYTQLPKILITSLHILLGLLVMGGFLALRREIPSFSVMTDPSILPVTLFTSVFGLVVALSLSYYGFSKIEASEATLFAYLQPLVYIPLSMLWLKEPVSLFQFVGLILVFVGVWWSTRSREPK